MAINGQIVDEINGLIASRDSIRATMVSANVEGVTNTSKLGFTTAEDESKSKYEKLKDTVSEEMKKAFRPEFLNRIDEIIVFKRLTEEDIKAISRLMLSNLKKRLDAIKKRHLKRVSAAERAVSK